MPGKYPLSWCGIVLISALAQSAEADITLEKLCRDVLDLGKRQPKATAEFDLNGDRKLAALEIVRQLVVKPEWFRTNLAEDFAAIDHDGDSALSGDEIRAFIDRGHTWKPSVAETPKPKPVSMREKMGLGNGAVGGGSGASLGDGSAYVFFGNQQAYIADYDVVNGQLDPVISVIGYGTMLEVSHVRVTIVRDR